MAVNQLSGDNFQPTDSSDEQDTAVLRELGDDTNLEHEKCACIAGWLLFRLFQTQDTCVLCRRSLTNSDTDCERMLFLHKKNFSNSHCDTGGLTVPSDQVVRAVVAMKECWSELSRCIWQHRGHRASARLQPAMKSAAGSVLQLHNSQHTDARLAAMSHLCIRMRLHHWCSVQQAKLRAAKRRGCLPASSAQRKVQRLDAAGR
jgi:hypothetical protein